jgi:hypothetical protein
MRRIFVGAGIVLGACGGGDGPPYVCDALEREEGLEVGRRPDPGEDRSPLAAGDQVRTYEVTAIGRESSESLAYRAAVLGCLLGLEKVPGSIRTWAERTEGRAVQRPLGYVPDRWETFEVDGVELYVLRLSAGDETRGGLYGRRDGETATLDILPDDVGFPIVQGIMEKMEDHGLIGADSLSIPPSFEERPSLSPARTKAGFWFHPRFNGVRLPEAGGVHISLAADGTPHAISVGDTHIDEGGLSTLFVGEIEAAALVLEAVPETGLVDRNETLYKPGQAGLDLVRWLYHRKPDDTHDIVTLSLTAEDGQVHTLRGAHTVDTTSWW